MERLAVEGHVFHRTCFKCHSCTNQLKPGSYEFDRVSNQFYCRTHYRDVVRHRTAKRTVDERNLASPTGEEAEQGAEPKRKKGSDVNMTSQDSNEVTKSKVMTSVNDHSEKVANANHHGNSAEPVATLTDVSRQESSRIRSELPSLLKNLAAAKEEKSQNGVKPPAPSAVHSISPVPPASETMATTEKASVIVASPRQPSSETQLPEKQLSGQQIAAEKEEKEVRQRLTTGAKGVEREEERGELPPVKPPRRRTAKFSSSPVSVTGERRQTAEPRSQVSRGSLAVFSGYIYLLCALVPCLALQALLYLYWTWQSL